MLHFSSSCFRWSLQGTLQTQQNCSSFQKTPLSNFFGSERPKAQSFAKQQDFTAGAPIGSQCKYEPEAGQEPPGLWDKGLGRWLGSTLVVHAPGWWCWVFAAPRDADTSAWGKPPAKGSGVGCRLSQDQPSSQRALLSGGAAWAWMRPWRKAPRDVPLRDESLAFGLLTDKARGCEHQT